MRNRNINSSILKRIFSFFSDMDTGAYLLLLGMLYSTIFFCSFVMGYKTVYLYGSIICSSVFVFPILFPLNDSITEILGAKISYFMILAIIVCEYIFSFTTHLLASMPSPDNWKNQEIYPILTSGFMHIAVADSISLAIGFFANTYVLDKWGIKFFGNSFFIRSLGCTAIGELFFTISTNLITFNFYSVANFAETLNIIISDYILKMVYSLIICIPNAYLVAKIKKAINKDNVLNHNLNVIEISKIRPNYRT